MSKHSEYVTRMTNGEPIARIGALWYGAESGTVVTNIYYFGNKNIQSIIPIRAESAISFSTSGSFIDTLQMELVINYSKFRSHLQRLTAQIQVSPVLPIQNVVVAALTQPVQTNKDVYVAYGFTTVNDLSIKNSVDKYSLMRMYASTPVQMKIDNMAIETISGSPRDIRVIMRLTRVLTATIYGDKVSYVRSMEGAINQHKYIKEILKEGGDNFQVTAMATMLGINAPDLSDMIEQMKNPLAIGEEIGDLVQAEIQEVLAPDLYRAMTDDGRDILVMPYGMECLNGLEKLRLFGMEEEAETALIHSEFGTNLADVKSSMEKAFGVSKGTAGSQSTLTEGSSPPSSVSGGGGGGGWPNPPSQKDKVGGIGASEKDQDKSIKQGSVTLTIVNKGPISLLDNDLTPKDDVLIHFCIITHKELADVGNTLLASGQGFHNPIIYKADKTPPGYTAKRLEAIKRGEEKAKKQTSGEALSASFCAQALAMKLGLGRPWEMRVSIRKKIGKGEADLVVLPPKYDAEVISIETNGNIIVRKTDNSSVTLRLQCAETPMFGNAYWRETQDFLNGNITGKTVKVQEVPNASGGAPQSSTKRAIIEYGRKDPLNVTLLKGGYAWFVLSIGSDTYAQEWYQYRIEAEKAKVGLWKDTSRLSPEVYRSIPRDDR